MEAEREDDHVAVVSFSVDRGGNGPLIADVDCCGGGVASREAVVVAKREVDFVEVFEESLEEALCVLLSIAMTESLEEILQGLL